MNVCVHCGITTAFGTCPKGCKSRVDPGKTASTIPWAMIPAKCWDCGALLKLAPHLREYMGQCPDCTYKHRSRLN